MQAVPDKELLSAGDTELSFRQLYDRYWEDLYSKALSRLKNDADAQDAVQEVFISLWRNRNTIELPMEGLSPYLFTALKYCIIKKMYRTAKKEVSFTLSVEELAKTELTADELLQYKQLQQIVADKVAKLPQRMKEVYCMSRREYLSVLEISQKLNLSEQTIKNTLTEALKKLRKELSKYSIWGLLFVV